MDGAGSGAPIGRPPADLTLAEQTALLDASLEVELRELARAGTPEWGEEDGVAWVVGAVPGAVVYRTTLGADVADERIDAIAGRFDDRALGVTWWARPDASPPDLRARLQRHGFHLTDDEAGMIADLAQLVVDVPRPAGLAFSGFGAEDQIDRSGVEAWLEVAGTTFGWLPERYEVRRALYLHDERRPRPWRHLVGWLDGRPVAMARILLAAGVAMVHGVAVVPEARRQGIGSAITAEALRRARDEEGYRIGVLQASSMGRGPYERIGFRTVARYGRYERAPSPAIVAGGEPAVDERDERAAIFERVIATSAPPPAEPRASGSLFATRPASRAIVDGWCFVGPYRDRRPGTPYEMDELLAEHARLGVGARLCLHAESRDGVPDEGNAAMSRLALVTPRTGVIWTALPPRRFGGASAERLLADAQAAGVAMFAMFPETHRHHLAPWANGDLYGGMEAARLPLVLDLEQAAYADVHAIATAHPRLPIVCWGAWYVDERLLVPLLDACPNVRIGLAGDRRVFNPAFGVEQSMARHGPGRLVFGSGWPRQSPGPSLSYVQYASVPAGAKSAILGGTVRELLAQVRWPVHGFEGGEAAP